ncbi:MAG: DUF1501 domain-containing protein [Thermoanaerobaculia bacterium]
MRTRRDFLRQSACGLSAAAFVSSLNRFGRLAAATLPTTDYRALVCIFLFGGNDGNNTVIPYDDYASYQAVRATTAALNISRDDLAKIDAPSHSSTFGLHPSLADLGPIYSQGDLAVVCNVGTLVQPIVRSEYLAGAPRPDSLFSHFDQQTQWQSAVGDGSSSLARTGWGGRTAEAAASLNSSPAIPTIISTAGVTLFSTGQTTRPLVPGSALAGFGSGPVAQTRYQALRSLLTLDLDKTLVASQSGITAAGIDDIAILDAAISSAAAIQTAFPSTDLGDQLRQIAQAIAARSTLQMSRQIFFASLGSFDTHTGQLATQSSLLGQVAQAMKAFSGAMEELGAADSVTTFTLSDFGRTFQPDSGGGSDHAWGSHHLVMGGAVRGGDFYGTYPTLALNGPDDAASEGRWIPTISVDQYGATLARWFGVSAEAISQVFPNIGAFDTADLGFF